jgi:hypothetical protein
MSSNKGGKLVLYQPPNMFNMLTVLEILHNRIGLNNIAKR